MLYVPECYMMSLVRGCRAMDPIHRDSPPADVEQLVGAMMALGLYSGTNTTAEHAAEIERFGPDGYRMRLVNVLLGAVQAETFWSEQLAGDDLQMMRAAHAEQLRGAGVMARGSDDLHLPTLMEFLRWQAVRLCGPLREVAQNPSNGPIPLAAAHAADGLQRLLGLTASGQEPAVETVQRGLGELRQARVCLHTAITNVDTALQMVERALTDRS